MTQSKQETYTADAWTAVLDRLPIEAANSHPLLRTLYAEHRYMATLLKMLGEQMAALEMARPVEPHIFYEVMHYMTRYPDEFHHPREDMLYQRAAELDKQLADSVDTLQRDHDYLTEVGAKALAAIADWRDGRADSSAVLSHCQDYVSSLYDHMNTEEKLIFPQIEKLLTEDDWFELEQDDLLTPVPDPVFGPRVGREYRNISRKARRAVRRGVEDAAMVEWIGIEAMLEGVELFSMAIGNTRAAAGEHVAGARADMKALLQDSLDGESSFLLLPARWSLSNAGHYIGWLKDCSEIAMDTVQDLRSLNHGVRQRIRWVTDGSSENFEQTSH